MAHVIKINLSFIDKQQGNVFQYLDRYYCPLCLVGPIDTFLEELDPATADPTTAERAVNAHLRRTLRRVSAPQDTTCDTCGRLATHS